MSTYISKSGDMLDDICFKAYGTEQAITTLLDVNPGLVNQPEKLPAGIHILLPVIQKPAVKTLNLWD